MPSILDIYEKSEFANAPKGKNKDKTPWSKDDNGEIDITDKALDTIRGVVKDSKYSDSLTNI